MKYLENVQHETDEVLKQAEEFRNVGNECFNNKEYECAIELFTAAIRLNGQNATYYGNRSVAYLQTNSYQRALEDATKSLELDPSYTKGYYRRATAYMSLGNFRLALKDYEIVKIGDNYVGPQLEEGKVTENFMYQLMEHYKAQKKLHTAIAYKILLDVKKQLMKLPSLIDISIPNEAKFTVCGDIHGQFYDLMNIFELNGFPSTTNPYLFNGDFVDRGSFSVECIFVLFGFKLLYPNHFFLVRGNHESVTMNQMYGFQAEVKAKYTTQMVLHGGLFSSDNVTLDDIRNIDRNRQPPDSGIMCELLWSDPMPGKGRSPSKRGIGIQFGSDVT
ncbi:hypothetical protein Pmani_033180 [Petrolisthes manimaculis]|uniref:Serine/threonine-protein phosphatase n=1 Tax=Petrolisthes manimaculis TaxID=1843537 RepID=A0AAE1NS40_9EUCA|nr:hypothetical protein Pmani_033180 [Petrolisthes manimaculis]